MKKIWIPVSILVILFIASGQTYEQQSIVPKLREWFPGEPFKELLSLIEVQYWGITVSVEERGYYYFVEFLIRKAAHFVIFGLLAIGIYLILPKWRSRFLLAALLTLGAAIADEFRQSFTGGRTQSGQDIMLDFAGAITFLIIFRLLAYWKSIRSTRKIASIEKT